MNVQRWAHALLAIAFAAPSLVSAGWRDDILLVKQHDWSSPGLLPWSTMPMVQARPGMDFDVRNSTSSGIAAFADKADSYTILGELSADTVQILKGDFDGNRRTDLALLDRFQNASRTMSVAYRNSDGSVSIRQEPIGQFADWAADRYASDAITGDFNGDKETDIALIRRSPGWTTAPVLLSRPGGGFTVANWDLGLFATWAASDAYKVRILTGDFNADGRTDLALVAPCGTWGTIPIAYAEPASGRFSIANHAAADFAQTCPSDGSNVVVAGDFNGDIATDLVRFSGGSMIVAETNSGRTGFAVYKPLFMEGFASRAQTSRTLVGRFGDVSYESIALVDKTPGTNGIAIAFGGMFGFRDSRFTDQLVPEFAGWAATPGVSAHVGDFDGNGLSDIALVQSFPGQGWATIPIAYSHINTAGCALFFNVGMCRDLRVENQAAPGFVDWARQRGVGVFIGDFAQ